MSKKPTVLMILDGYGLNDHLIEQAKEDGIDTILTCDNGIAAADQIGLANTCGMTVVVTDHHEVPYEEQEGERIYHMHYGNVCRYFLLPFQQQK